MPGKRQKSKDESTEGRRDVDGVEVEDVEDGEESDQAGVELNNFYEIEIDPVVMEFHEAIEEGQIDDALRLMKSVGPNQVGPQGDTALHLACLYGHERLVGPLIAQGADVNAADEDDSTPLHDASAGGYVGIVRALLDAGASAVAADQDGDTALHNAANGNHPQVVKMLLEAGANPDVVNGEGSTPKMLATDDEVVALFDR